jgi:putative DNA primase/helicase
MSIDADAIEVARAVRLEDELARRGIRLRRSGAERTGACPLCGGGKNADRFWVNTRKQIWGCRGCHPKADNVIGLVQHLDGSDFAEAIRSITGIVDLDRRPSAPDPVKLAEAQAKAEAQAEARARDELADVRQRMAQARSIWQEAVPIEGTLAEVYLRTHRRLDVPNNVSGSVLRFHGRCPFGAAHYPCMVALVRNVINDKEQAIVRTALRPDGGKLKLDGKTARKAKGPIGGGAIKVSDNAEVTTGLTIGEGIETVLAGMMAPTWYRPAWSLLSAGNIAAFPVLTGIESLTILVDHDRPDQHGRRAGQKAVAECARRWDAAGREVVPVIPTAEGFDMADVVHRRA